MNRLQADLVLVLVALIWGTAFVAQKTALDSVPPMLFVAARFFLSTLFVLPFALREYRRTAPFRKGDRPLVAMLCLVFLAGATLQQIGLVTTSVTNAGFLTGLYVVIVPFLAWMLFKRPPSWAVWPASILSLGGVFLLGGGALSALNNGDIAVIASAFGFAGHVVLMGLLLTRSRRPLVLSTLCYAVATLGAFAIAVVTEPFVWSGLIAAGPEILYAGIMSGGVAYTLQAIAQQHTPPADAAVIMSGEALFAALAGGLLLGEMLGLLGWIGCGMIMAAILLVELGPLLLKRRRPVVVREPI